MNLTTEWRRWWAWYPVRVDGRLRWLTFVERREMCVDEIVPQWVYRMPEGKTNG